MPQPGENSSRRLQMENAREFLRHAERLMDDHQDQAAVRLIILAGHAIVSALLELDNSNSEEG